MGMTRTAPKTRVHTSLYSEWYKSSVFGVVQIIFSQLPNFHELWWLFVVAAIMSFSYTTIAIGLSLVQTITGSICIPLIIHMHLSSEIITVQMCTLILYVFDLSGPTGKTTLADGHGGWSGC
jgi:hypothetical protein